MPGTFRVFRSLEEARPHFGPSALTIGNFDGVHAGHRRILRRVREMTEANGWKASALTFEPHPAKVVAPERAPRLMTTPEQRCPLMRQEGIEQVLILPFTAELALLTPEQFVHQILVNGLQTKSVLVGENFRFGHKQAGDVALLTALGKKLGFATEVIPAVTLRNTLVSSSEIRRLVESGSVARACRLLERPFALEGEVVRGHGIGSTQTVPTLNLATVCEVLPASGVYVTRTHDLGGQAIWPSITNIGYRPTFGGDQALSIETFLLRKLEEPAPERIRVEFLLRLRDERKFESPVLLKQQILRDVARAQRYHRRVPCHN